MAQKYKNIPVKPETYAQLRMIAGVNNRGLGDQVSAWCEAELPECAHEKAPVTVEVFGAGASSIDKQRLGYLCKTCNRVYHYITVVPHWVGVIRKTDKTEKTIEKFRTTATKAGAAK